MLPARALLIGVALAATACGGREEGADKPEVPAVAAAVSFDGASAPTTEAKLAHGERLSWVLGCRGCHGKDLQGKPWVDSPEEGLLHASNLTLALPDYSDAQLKRLLMAGEHRTRPELWDMPSELFQHLSAADLDALIAHLRTVPPAGKPSPTPVVGREWQALVDKGELKPAAALVAETARKGPPDLGDGHALGRYITRVTCAECHGPELKGKPNGNPDLVVAGAYSRAEFEKLITQGVPTGGRKLKPLMVNVSQNRFTKLTPGERDALYAYLKARAERPQ